MLKKIKLIPALLLGCSMFAAVLIAGCNGSGDAKDVKVDSPVVKMDTPAVAHVRDTTMDTAKKVDKPINNP